MKKLLTLAVGLLALSAAHADVVWKADPPAGVPEKASLMQVLPTPVSRTLMERRATSLGFPRQGTFIKTPVGLALQSGPFVYQANTMGSEFMANTDLYLSGKPGLEPLSDERAKGLAGEFLKGHFPRIEAEGRILQVRHLMNQAQDVRTGKLDPPTQDESIVEFGRFLNGIPVVGPGDKARLHLANDGSITGFQNVWRNTQIIGVLIGLLKFSEVQKEFLSQLTEEMGDGSVRVFVNKIEFGYYSRPENQAQGFYQPCYLFSVSFFNEKLQQETGARLIPVAAIDPRQMKEPLDIPPDVPQNGDPSRILFGDVQKPTLPGSVPLVKVLPTDISSDALSRRMAKLGGKPETVKEAPRGLMVTDGTSNTILYADDRGTEFFAHLDRFLTETPGAGNPIPDADAIRAASNWLEYLGDMDKGEIGLAVQHLFHQSFDLEKNVENPPTQDESIVLFPRLLPNPKGETSIPIVGQGTGLEIHVDNAGRITGHRRVWRNLAPTQTTLDIRPYLEQEAAFIRLLTPELGDYIARVTEIKFGYFGRPEGYEQGWLLPAVLYEVDLINPATGEVTAHRQIPIPASANQPEDLEDPDAAGAPPVADDTRSADTVPTLYGDIDGDGAVTTKDAGLAMQMYGGMADSLIAPPLFTAGDVAPKGAPDGQIAMDDGLRILRSIFQLDDISNGP